MDRYRFLICRGEERIYITEWLSYSEAIDWLRKNCGSTYYPYRANGVDIYAEKKVV